jgi:hypothetical protein
MTVYVRELGVIAKSVFYISGVVSMAELMINHSLLCAGKIKE